MAHSELDIKEEIPGAEIDKYCIEPVNIKNEDYSVVNVKSEDEWSGRYL